jgi:hypothetical protein
MMHIVVMIWVRMCMEVIEKKRMMAIVIVQVEEVEVAAVAAVAAVAVEVAIVIEIIPLHVDPIQGKIQRHVRVLTGPPATPITTIKDAQEQHTYLF